MRTHQVAVLTQVGLHQTYALDEQAPENFFAALHEVEHEDTANLVDRNVYLKGLVGVRVDLQLQNLDFRRPEQVQITNSHVFQQLLYPKISFSLLRKLLSNESGVLPLSFSEDYCDVKVRAFQEGSQRKTSEGQSIESFLVT